MAGATDGSGKGGTGDKLSLDLEKEGLRAKNKSGPSPGGRVPAPQLLGSVNVLGYIRFIITFA